MKYLDLHRYSGPGHLQFMIRSHTRVIAWWLKKRSREFTMSVVVASKVKLMN